MTYHRSNLVHIWSHEHNAWWRPSSMGYTTDISQAGVYERAEAQVIVDAANMLSQNEEIREIEWLISK